MSRLIIIADDLTGAADTAACFAQAGLHTVVMLPETGFWPLGPQNPVSSGVHYSETGISRLSSQIPVSTEVFSLSTDSRQLTADEASRRVRQAVGWLQQNGFVTPGTLFYKKVDSLMRGHPAVELGAMLDALGLDRALIAPAFPAQGRVTLNGRQVIGSGASIRQIDLGEVFDLPHAGPSALHWLSLDRSSHGWTTGEPGLYIADAASEAGLEALAGELPAQGFRLACGSAGLARALQRVNWPGRTPSPALPDRSRAAPAVLVVAGSRAPALARQVEAARQSGIRVVTPGPSFLEEGPFQPEELALALAEILSARQPAILTTVGLPVLPQGDEIVAGRLAAVTGWLVEASLVGGLVLTGGDTAAAVCHRLGASLIELHVEPVPGIATGALLDGTHPGLPVITKAGAFECDLRLLIDDLRE
jgi:uncharacterized protein YgbK (DUF1537 family)